MTNPKRTLSDDIAALHHEAKALVSAGNQVLILSHSYGGVVATNAITADLSISARHKEGKQGGILGMVYLCAFILQKGQCVVDIVSESGCALDIDLRDDGTCFPKNPVEAFYQDVEARRAEELKGRLDVHATSAQVEKCSYEAWRGQKVGYIFCEADEAIVLKRQRRMVEAVGERGVDVETQTLECGHSPFVVCPERVVELVGGYVKEWTGVA
ncbi:MAG: hypothetical protein Q9159_005331 [Coniocarpon cinnabarinum]